jgi:hypothetical protein
VLDVAVLRERQRQLHQEQPPTVEHDGHGDAAQLSLGRPRSPRDYFPLLRSARPTSRWACCALSAMKSLHSSCRLRGRRVVRDTAKCRQSSPQSATFSHSDAPPLRTVWICRSYSPSRSRRRAAANERMSPLSIPGFPSQN